MKDGGNNMLSKEEMIRKDNEYIVRGWGKVGEPMYLVEGKGPMVKDIDGKEYLDCSSGLFSNNAGHCHPKIVQAIKDQAEKLIQPSMRHSNIPAVELAEKLAQIAPGDLKKVIFTTGGGETTEMALKLARGYTGKWEIIALRNAFHGLGFGSIALTSGAKYKKDFGPVMPGVVRAPHAYCYRCPFKYPECDLWCADEIGRIAEDKGLSASHNGQIGSVIIEPIQGSGGIVPPEGWLTRVREICDKYGLLLIVDEIQTGFGRTGKMFACDHEKVVPDILATSKNVGGSLPAGAVITTEKIIEGFNPGTTPTLAGNAVACAAGLALINTLIEEKLVENAAAMGKRLTEGILNMATSKYVGQVRYKGLMGSIEFVLDKKTKEPMPKKDVNWILGRLAEEGILTSASGPCGNSFRVQPTLDINKDQIDMIVNTFDKILREYDK